jgi:hypothetical protein
MPSPKKPKSFRFFNSRKFSTLSVISQNAEKHQ